MLRIGWTLKHGCTVRQTSDLDFHFDSCHTISAVTLNAVWVQLFFVHCTSLLQKLFNTVLEKLTLQQCSKLSGQLHSFFQPQVE